MTTRIRHYHLGCGESLVTHYDRLWDENQLFRNRKKKTRETKMQQNFKKTQVKD